MNIAIIGAGPAGIISARNAIKAGHSVVLFEKNTRIGGIWNPWSGGAYRNACMQNVTGSFKPSGLFPPALQK
ncbi:NAD(P)-binding protein [Escherichia coli]|uniref:NAD(P)-binding protein n=1 Tax=Escherichia coli TaxID=562 RepID=UPI000E5D336B|nr:NAD(P)-binding protein [Escherichia coli]AXZ78651.1 FAD-dependent oxidoreductase [Escherichia coli]